MKNQIRATHQVFYEKEYETLSYFLYGFALIFLGAGILLPISLISKFPSNLIGNNPSVLILPIYIAILLFAFSTMSYMVAILLKKPSQDTIWVEMVLEGLGTILIIIGIIAFFFITSKSSDTISQLENLGVIGGVTFLAINGMFGVLCIGISEAHSKYNSDSPSLRLILNRNNQSDNDSRFCSNCGSRVTDETIVFCEECGTKL